MIRLAFALTTLIVLSATMTSPATAQEPNSISDRLAEARSKFAERTSQARTNFLAAIAKREESLSKRVQLDDLKRFRNEKDAFLADGSIPTNPFVALERKNFENELSKAKFNLKKSLETAKSEYAKAGMIAEAEAIDSELRAGASPVVERVEKEKAPLDPIVGFWRIVIGKPNEKQTILNVYFPPVDNPGVRSAMARRNQTSPVKYFQGNWSKSGDIYTLHGPNGATAKVKMGGGGEGFAGRLAAGAPLVGFRQQR